MKIGIDARSLSKQLTGIGTYVYELVVHLNNIDGENEYVLYSNKELCVDLRLSSRWRIVVNSFPIGTIWLNIFMPINIIKDKIDIFWGTTQILPIIKYKCINILTVHDLALLKYPVGSWSNTIIQKLFLYLSCKAADRIIAVSNSTKEDFIEHFHLNEKKIRIIYSSASEYLHPIDKMEAREYLKNKYNINHDFILYLGTIEPRKNIKTIIKAFYKAKKSKEFNCKLIIAGGYGWNSKDVYELVKKLNLGDGVRFLGYIEQSDKIYLYNGCEFFVFTSIYEGFGIPLLEAMRCRKTTISTNISAMPEVVGDTGLMIDNYNDYKTLSSHFIKLYTDKEFNDVLASMALERSLQFSYLECAKSTLKLFKETYRRKRNRCNS